MNTMKALLLGGSLLIASLVPLSANAETPSSFIAGRYVKISGTILCDTFTQLDEIMSAQEKSFEAAKKVYQKWTTTLNALNQKSCMYVGAPRWFEGVPNKVVKTYVVYTPSGKQVVTHALSIVWTDRNGTKHAGFFFSDREIVDEEDVSEAL